MTTSPKVPSIYAVSTFCEDTCIYSESGKIEVTPGGPAIWIQRALEAFGVSPHIITGDKPVSTEVVLVKGEPLPGKLFTNNSRIHLSEPLIADGFIINFLDDFDIELVKKLSGIVLLDIAPYTRVGPFRQEKASVPVPSREARAAIDILKANHEEYPFIPQEWVEEQKSERILLHTLGRGGVDLWVQGSLIHFDARYLEVRNVLGAGDTFGSSFLYYYLTNGHNPADACMRAMERVYQFLLEKNRTIEGLAV
jgi:pfkB family carbohydrate kinase